ncbi:hypothetical protein NDU88_005485 [Pleurodeles waltl]|uniref:Uncharacterized protein n=1 Tax=Pleurodeles waltl TaxID=8319 RepID=A0AAV7L4Q7_PLEWA|nr:hypothetical protein NDU88_005485 [Pleurodeles waltl]
MGVLRDGRRLKRKRRAFFSSPYRETESVRRTEEFGNAKEGGGRDRERNSQQGKWRQAEAGSPRDVEPLARKGELHRGHEETRQPRAGEGEGRGSTGAGHVLGRTWPAQVRVYTGKWGGKEA